MIKEEMHLLLHLCKLVAQLGDKQIWKAAVSWAHQRESLEYFAHLHLIQLQLSLVPFPSHWSLEALGCMLQVFLELVRRHFYPQHPSPVASKLVV